MDREMEERVLVFAPTGREAAPVCEILAHAGLASLHCQDFRDLCREIRAGAGAAVLAEEALFPYNVKALLEVLNQQGSWSDLPLIVLTGRSPESRPTLQPLRRSTLLERPVGVATLISACQTALGARRLQYEVRDLLDGKAEADRSKAQFMTLLGHELRNPLAALQNAGSVLTELISGATGATGATGANGTNNATRFAQDDDKDLALRQCQVIDRQTRHLRNLVDDLLGMLASDRITVRETASEVGAARPNHAPRADLRILVVEDNPDGRESLRDLLEIWGYQVGLAENGPEGLAQALASPYNVALIDIGLPGFDGNEVARRIRSRLNGHTPCLIAMTGYGQPEDEGRARQAGFDTFLVKPVDPAALARLLAEVCDSVARPAGTAEKLSRPAGDALRPASTA
ncbi:MAG TPA: response regulator [Thermoanaerobaculia bacterium]|nr:response regulator [Thermoanaerobaculia bacterium]